MRKQLNKKQIIGVIKDSFGSMEHPIFWPNSLRDLSDKQLVAVVKAEFRQLRDQSTTSTTGFSRLSQKRLYAVARDIYGILCQREGRTLGF